ncbi:putative RNA helicase, partial [Pestalotiopsis sp. IQ-011]
MAVTELERLEGRSGEAPTFVRDDLYEERDTGGAGIAVFATEPIESGTRLFCEEPLIAVPGEATQLDVFRAVAALPVGRRRAYGELAACSKPSKDLDWITELRRSSEGEEESFNALVEAHERAWSVYETNRFNMRFPDGDRKFGVFHK